MSCSEVWFSVSFTSSNETSPCSSPVSSVADVSISGLAVCDNSAKSSFETCIFSGVFLALFDGKIGVPLFKFRLYISFQNHHLLLHHLRLHHQPAQPVFLTYKLRYQ